MLGYQEIIDDKGNYVGETYLPDEWEDDEHSEQVHDEDSIPADEFDY